MMKTEKSKEALRVLLELRRSNASAKHTNKKKYSSGGIEMVKKTKVIWAEVITKSAFFETDDYDVIRSMIFNDETTEIERVESHQVETIEIMEGK